MGQPQTEVEDAAIVLAWAGEFRAACLSAAAGPGDATAMQRLRFLLGAPASAALAAQQRMEARQIGTPLPALALVHDTERPS